MKQARGWITAVVIAFLAVWLMTDWLTKAIAFLTSVPWFVYLILAAILYCGYKFVTLAREDHKADQEWIEEEGSVFIRRMEQEKERRTQVAGAEYDEDAFEREVEEE